MKKQIPQPVLITIIVIVVAGLAIWGYNALRPAADKDFIPADPSKMPPGMPGAPMGQPMPPMPPAGPGN